MDQGEPRWLSTVKPTPLPPPLTTIVVPDEFYPSSFVQLERCPVSVLGALGADERGLLVPHPTVFLGLILHHARQQMTEGRWGIARDPQQAASEILTGAVDDANTCQAGRGCAPPRCLFR